MSDLTAQIQAEIDKVEQLMEDQKHLLRRSLDNPPVVEAAEAELKALHTRLARLKGNLRKETCRSDNAGLA
jgi:uncharacterized protein involved in exopolysaccharide biosynthesis